MIMLRKKGWAVFTVLVLMFCLFASHASANTHWQYWSDGIGYIDAVNGPGGNYSVYWSNVGNFVIGKGWAVGSPNRVVNTTPVPGIRRQCLLDSLWMDAEIAIEYYVVDSWGTLSSDRRIQRLRLQRRRNV